MKDIAKAYELSNTKMKKVHGHTRIVLRNSLSGNIVKEVESENTFQSGILADLFDNIPFLNQNNARSWSDMVGGLLLFRDTITVGTRFMPAGNKMIGNGYRDATNSSTPLELGSFNSIDSFARFQNGTPTIYQVWDFNNNQANGKISSVCLTSKIGGAIGYGNATGSYRTTDWNLRSFSQDNTEWTETYGDDDKTYRFYVNSDGTVTVTETVRVAIKGSTFSGLSTSYTLTPDTTFGQDIYVGYARATNVGNNRMRFMPMGTQHYAQNSTVKYYEFDTSDKSLIIKSFTVNNPDGVDRRQYSYWSEAYSFIFTRSGKVICPDAYNGTNLVIVDLSDSSYVRSSDVKFVGTYSRYHAGEIADGLIVAEGIRTSDSNYFSGVWYMIDTVNGTTYPMNCSTDQRGNANACDDKGMCESHFADYTGKKYIYKNPLYLATINNLSPAVEKDSTLTMRVMYTLEEA